MRLGTIWIFQSSHYSGLFFWRETMADPNESTGLTEAEETTRRWEKMQKLNQIEKISEKIRALEWEIKFAQEEITVMLKEIYDDEAQRMPRP